MLKTILLVGFGGGLGSIFRYLTSRYTEKYFDGTFPLATFFVNIIGCFIIGLLIGILSQSNIEQQQNLKYLWITGFCGGYTTFSTFSYESILLFKNGQLLIPILYIASSVIVGLLAIWLGLKLSH